MENITPEEIDNIISSRPYIIADVLALIKHKINLASENSEQVIALRKDYNLLSLLRTRLCRRDIHLSDIVHMFSKYVHEVIQDEK